MSDRDPWEEWDDVLGGLDPETDTELYQAAVDRAMTLEIGLAARCHVALDQVLHTTVAALTGTSMPPNASTSQLIDHIERAITERRFSAPPPMRRHGRHYRRRGWRISIGTGYSTISGWQSLTTTAQVWSALGLTYQGTI